MKPELTEYAAADAALLLEMKTAWERYSSEAINVAMATVRRRILADGLCGVPTNASSCVGRWCDATRAAEWGAHYSRLPEWP